VKTSRATSILKTNSTYRNLSAQRISEHIILSYYLFLSLWTGFTVWVLYIFLISAIIFTSYWLDFGRRSAKQIWRPKILWRSTLNEFGLSHTYKHWKTVSHVYVLDIKAKISELNISNNSSIYSTLSVFIHTKFNWHPFHISYLYFMSHVVNLHVLTCY
jgi:hypothetical protein